MKKATLAAFTAIIACTLPVAILPAMAQYTCGLQAGKYAKYTWSMTGSVLGQSYSTSGSIDVNIQSVTGTTYSANATFTANGGNLPTGLLNVPSTTQTVSGDVSSGLGTTGFIGLLAIPANLTATSSVPGVGNVERIGSWNGRSAVVVNSSNVSLGQGDTYYDQKTGILLYSKTPVNYLGLYTFSYELQLTDTDLWSSGRGSNLTMWMVIVVIIIVAMIAVATVVMLRRKKPAPATTQTAPQQNPPPPPPPTTA
jgi:hypothetical protein